MILWTLAKLAKAKNTKRTNRRYNKQGTPAVTAEQGNISPPGRLAIGNR